MQFTINLSNAEYKALASVAVSPQEWIENVVHDRCRIAMDEIIAAEVQRKLAAGEAITGSKDDIVMGAAVESAADRQNRFEAERSQMLSAQ